MRRNRKASVPAMEVEVMLDLSRRGPVAQPPASPRTPRVTRLMALAVNRRNLMLSGDMQRNFQVRTVSENKAKASNSTRKDRIKAWITNKIEPWIVFSARNRTAVLDATNRILIENKSRLMVEKALGGKQL